MNYKLISAIAAGVLSLASTASFAAGTYQEFTVNDGSVPGATPVTFVADYIGGSYSEVLTINADSSFDTAAYATFDAYYKNDGADQVISNVNNLGTNGYKIYAIFYSSGTVGVGTFTGLSGSFDLFIDTNQDTTLDLGLSGGSDIITGNITDDYKIASASNLTSAIGILGNPGAFDLFFNDFTLTTGDQNLSLEGTQNGDLYFTQPRPFHLIVNVDGDFDNFDPTPGTTIPVGGNLSAVFVVPEPGSLALVGLSLLGLGFVGRRNKKF